MTWCSSVTIRRVFSIQLQVAKTSVNVYWSTRALLVLLPCFTNAQEVQGSKKVYSCSLSTPAWLMFKPCGNSRLKLVSFQTSGELSAAMHTLQKCGSAQCKGNCQKKLIPFPVYQFFLPGGKIDLWIGASVFPGVVALQVKKASPNLTAGSSKTCAFNPEILQPYKLFLCAHAVNIFVFFDKDMIYISF